MYSNKIFKKIVFLIELCRPYQYVKNALIFAPLFFAGQFLQVGLLLNTIVATISFSLAASAVYAFNDLKDVESDKKHPKKKFRPLASGKVTPSEALAMSCVLVIFSLIMMFIVNPISSAILFVYIILNVLYSLHLKHIAIIDVFIIAIGFLLRIFIGAAVTGIFLSEWIVLITLLLALVLGFGKRRDDVLILEGSGKKMRKVISGYNLQFLDTTIAMLSATIIVSYIMYTIESSANNDLMQFDYLYITVIFVLVGVLRYFQQLYVYKASGSPTKILLKDRFMQLFIFFWIISFVVIIYLPRII